MKSLQPVCLHKTMRVIAPGPDIVMLVHEAFLGRLPGPQDPVLPILGCSLCLLDLPAEEPQRTERWLEYFGVGA